jgi:predicted nucleic-acid-binding Zn-ribbon protein
MEPSARLSGDLGQATTPSHFNRVRKEVMMATIEERLSEAFQCPKCDHSGAHVERLAMSGTGISRLFEVQPYRYAFTSCLNCGYTEIYNLKTLEGKDDLGTFLEILFAD